MHGLAPQAVSVINMMGHAFAAYIHIYTAKVLPIISTTLLLRCEFSRGLSGLNEWPPDLQSGSRELHYYTHIYILHDTTGL